MKVQFISKCGIGGLLYRPGDKLDLAKKNAEELIDAGKCIPVETKKKAKTKYIA